MGSQLVEEIRTILYVEVEYSIVCGSVHVKSTHRIDMHPPPIFLKFGTYVVHLKLFNHKKNWSPYLYGFVVTLVQTSHFHYNFPLEYVTKLNITSSVITLVENQSHSLEHI